MNERLIKLAERLGLSHKASKIERREFLRGMLSLGAVVAVPGGLALPERKIWQVPRESRDFRDEHKILTFSVASAIRARSAGPSMPLGGSDLPRGAKPVYAGGKLVGWTEPRPSRDFHLANAARVLGISYQEAYLRRDDPEVIWHRNKSKEVHFAISAGGITEAQMLRAMRHGIVVDRKLVAELRERFRETFPGLG